MNLFTVYLILFLSWAAVIISIDFLPSPVFIALPVVVLVNALFSDWYWHRVPLWYADASWWTTFVVLPGYLYSYVFGWFL